MNKEIPAMWIFMAILILVAGVITFGLHIEHRNFQDFCEDNGFESYEKGAWRGIDHVCIKVEDGYRVEKKFDSCGKVFCFIKNDDTLVSQEEQ